MSKADGLLNVDVDTWYEEAIENWENAIEEVGAILDREIDPARAAAEIQRYIEPFNPPSEELDGTLQCLEVVAEGEELIFRETEVICDDVRVRRAGGRWVIDGSEIAEPDKESVAFWGLSVVWWFNEPDIAEIAGARRRMAQAEEAESTS